MLSVAAPQERLRVLSTLGVAVKVVLPSTGLVVSRMMSSLA